SLEVLDRLARFQTEPIGQKAPQLLVAIERFRLAARAVERQHELSAQPLPQRMLGYEGLELADQVRMAGQRKVGFDSLLEDGQPQVLESGDLTLRERLVRDVGEGRSTPQRERRPKNARGLGSASLGQRSSPLGQKLLEARRIDFIPCEHQQIARRLA